LVPLLHPLVFDPESIIRQHLASQLLPLAIVCMVVLDDDNNNNDDDSCTVAHRLQHPTMQHVVYSESLHTVAHVLGSDLFQKDLLPVFLEHFVTDSDDSVQWNVLTHFPQLLELQPPEKWIFFVGEMVRISGRTGFARCEKETQRDQSHVAKLAPAGRSFEQKSIPSLLLHWVSPTQVHKQVWPVVQQLLQDPVAQVREKAPSGASSSSSSSYTAYRAIWS